MGPTGEKRELRSTVRISKTSVEAVACPALGGRSTIWDTELKGFGLRVTSSGTRTYVLRYRMGGRNAAQRSVTIGQHGSPWTAEQARRRAAELLTMVRSGVDPASQRQAADKETVDAQRSRADRMFDKLADRWFNSHVKGKLKSEKDIEGVLKRDLKPAFAGMTIDEVTKAVAAKAIDAIGSRSNAAANKAFKWLRQMLNWLIKKDVIEHSPLDRAGRPFDELSRKRVLGLLELMVVWSATNQLPAVFRDYYRMMILVGQRLREVSNVPWSEIDAETAEWLIPSERMKNNRPHLVPLSDQACNLLGLADDQAGRNNGPVFTTNGRTGLAGFSKMKEALDSAVSDTLAKYPQVQVLLGGSLANWVVHDFRRTLGTNCQAMGIRLEVTEAVLSHVSGERGGLTGVYQLYDYFEEKADALARWGQLVEQAVQLFKQESFEDIMNLDPVFRAKRERRARRRSATASITNKHQNID